MSKMVKQGSGNSRFIGAGKRVSPQEEMCVFDRLPPVLRAAFANASSDSTCTEIVELLDKAPAAAVAWALTEVMRDKAVEFITAEFGAHAVPILLPQARDSQAATRPAASRAPAEATRANGEEASP